MGATTFMTHAKGKTAKEAFLAAREEACYERGHGGYTGTIAEKDRFTMIQVPGDAHPAEYAGKLIDDRDSRVDDKWGPAGCIQLSKDEFLFFGWASE